MNANTYTFGLELELQVPDSVLRNQGLRIGAYHVGTPVPFLPNGWTAQRDASLQASPGSAGRRPQPLQPPSRAGTPRRPQRPDRLGVRICPNLAGNDDRFRRLVEAVTRHGCDKSLVARCFRLVGKQGVEAENRGVRPFFAACENYRNSCELHRNSAERRTLRKTLFRGRLSLGLS